ncbi:MAG: hypothetical protein FJZ01_00490 [Candidatus Sericytochromatia bacterium]|nr:hypothetical protein [Candidatus Tanganyikabacteria bacterium]
MAKVDVDVRSSRIPENVTGGLSRAAVGMRTDERSAPHGDPPPWSNFHSPQGMAYIRSRNTGELALNR